MTTVNRRPATGFPVFVSSFSNLIKLSSSSSSSFIPHATVTIETGTKQAYLIKRKSNWEQKSCNNIFAKTMEKSEISKCAQEDRRRKLKVQVLSPRVTVNYTYCCHWTLTALCHKEHQLLSSMLTNISSSYLITKCATDKII
jgi:hypothetical protein